VGSLRMGMLGNFDGGTFSGNGGSHSAERKVENIDAKELLERRKVMTIVITIIMMIMRTYESKHRCVSVGRSKATNNVYVSCFSFTLFMIQTTFAEF